MTRPTSADSAPGGARAAGRPAHPTPQVGYLAAAAVAAAVLATVMSTRLAVISRDGTHFIHFARQLSEDPAFYIRAHRSQPGYPACVLAVHELVRPWAGNDDVAAWVRSGQVVSGAGYVAFIPLCYVLARRLFSDAVARVTVLFALAMPAGLQLAGDVLSDMPHLAMFLVGVLLAHHALRGGWMGRYVAVGVAAAAAYLLRQEALALIAGTLVCIWWPAAQGAGPLSRRLGASAALVFGFVVPLLPYAAVTGSIFHKKNLRELLFGPQRIGARADWSAAGAAALADKGRAVADRPPRPAAVLAAATEPPALMFRVLEMLDGWARCGRYVVAFYALFGLLWPGAPPADASLRRLIAVLIALQCAAVQLRWASFEAFSARYMLIPTVLMVPWAGRGAWLLVDVWRMRQPQVPRLAAWMLLTAVAGGPMLFFGLKPINAERAYLRLAGEWLRVNSRVEDEVVGDRRVCEAAFYSGRHWNVWPERTWSAAQTLERIRQTGARWYLHLAGERASPAEDRAVLEAVLTEWRGGGAAIVYECGPPAARLTIVQLRD